MKFRSSFVNTNPGLQFLPWTNSLADFARASNDEEDDIGLRVFLPGWIILVELIYCHLQGSLLEVLQLRQGPR